MPVIQSSWGLTYEFACKSRACAPPPIGKGGSIGPTGAETKQKIGAGVAARSVAKRAEKVEPGTTGTVKSAIESAGGRMDGLDYRLKTPASLKRKILKKSIEKGISVKAAAKEIADAVRYTGVIPEPPKGNYAKTIKTVIKDLEKQGMTITEIETHWKRGDAYNGVHITANAKNGTKVEIQFHTEASLAAKGKTHEIYERAREVGISPEERARLTREMIKIADQSPIPSGAIRLGKKVFRPT